MTVTLADPGAFARAHATVDNGSQSWRTAKPGSAIPFVASTSTRARDGMQLRASGWRTQRYEANPVILWCHQHQQPPIGRAEVTKTGEHVRGLAYFDQDDEFAQKVERKYRTGMMSGFSVGWDFVDGNGRSVDWRRMHPDDLRDRAFYDLTEISAVPVPSDPNALTERARAGMRALTRQLREQFPDEDEYVEYLRHTDPAPAVSGIDPSAARSLLAAFNLKGES